MAGSILWFKRDLRVVDHPALVLAAAQGPVLPLFIVEPELWSQPDASARQWSFVAESLEDLRVDLGLLGQPLVVRVGDAVDVLGRLCRSHGINRLMSHQETGNLWTYARDRRVAGWARDAGVEWVELTHSSVTRRLVSRDGWAELRDRRIAAPMADSPPALQRLDVEPGVIPSARALQLAGDRCPHRQVGGRAQGLALLDGFLTRRGQGYRAAMSSPLSGERACSRLSPHLAWGTLSGREVAQAAAARRDAARGQREWSGSLRSFEARLAWRDHFMQKLEDQPSIETRCLHPAYEGLRPREADAARLAAWGAGETGVPFVDACMRYLNATGWLNFRMRAMLVSFASYHLWLDWRATGPLLARAFTDYEPGIHWPQIQMQSGTTGMNTVRIYNPVKQGWDQDPAGAFTRRWVPELADLPDHYLQEPWRWTEARRVLGGRYPEPLVDLAAAARAAREAVWGVRTGAAFRAEAERIAEKHASRKDRAGRFVNDRAPVKRRAKPVAPGQLGFDF